MARLANTNKPQHQTQTSNIAELLERVLDKGIMIAGDVKIKLVDIELLTIQIRLVICSIDKAKEMGMDWWANSAIFGNEEKSKTDAVLPEPTSPLLNADGSVDSAAASAENEVQALRDRVRELEQLVRRSGGEEEALPIVTAPTRETAPLTSEPRRFRPVTPRFDDTPDREQG